MVSGRIVHYREDLAVGARGWALFAFAVAITAMVGSPKLVPVTVAAWIINLARYHGASVAIDDTHVYVGQRSAPLAAFDPSTLDRASNTWPWRTLDTGWLGANPIWTADSVGLRGVADGQPVWLAVGTNHREQLVAELLRGMARSRHLTGAPLTDTPMASGVSPVVVTQAGPPRGWYADPWNPVVQLRWWDGRQWTGHVHPRGIHR